MRCSLSAVAAAGATALEDVPMSPAGRGEASPARSPALTYLGSPSICGSPWGASPCASPSPAPSPAKSARLARMFATPPPMPRSAAAASPGARTTAALPRSGAAASPMQKGAVAVSPMVYRSPMGKSPMGKSPMLALSPGGEIRRNAGILGIPLNLRSDGEVSLPVPVRSVTSSAVIAPSPARRGAGGFQMPVVPMCPAAPIPYTVPAALPVGPAMPAPGVATTAAIQGIARPFMRSGVRRGGA